MPRHSQLLQRTDFEIAVFAASLGTASGLYYESAYTGLTIGAASIAAVYGVRILNQARASHDGQELGVSFARAVESIRRPAVAQDAPEAMPEIDARLAARWRTSLLRFLLAGKLAGGFSNEKIVSRKYVSDWNWRNYFVPVLKENHVLEDHGKDGVGYSGTLDYRGACAIVRNCDLTLPNRPPPRVNL